MDIKYVNDKVSVSSQITLDDLKVLKRLGVATIVSNRPDNEEESQIPFSKVLVAASLMRINAIHIPFVEDQMTTRDVDQLANLLKSGQRVHLFCRSGQRSAVLWAMSAFIRGYKEAAIVQHVNDAGYKLSAEKLEQLVSTQVDHHGVTTTLGSSQRRGIDHYDVLVVGGGSGGLAICASLKKRDSSLRIAVVEPSHKVFYQPGWTMVGGGVFNAKQTKRYIKGVLVDGVTWIQYSVASFLPKRNLVKLDNDVYVHYQQLVVATGLELHWDAIEGLRDTLGANGVTSNYRYDLAPYTWDLVQSLDKGNAIFTQPPMPIKCAGAPQKAMYLSADYWQKNNRLENIDVRFYSSGDGIFGVQDYVPALNKYLKKYAVDTHFKSTLIKVDGKKRIASFAVVDERGDTAVIDQEFDMLHVCPPQRAPACIRNSELSDQSGWLEVDQFTLKHNHYANIWGLGDVINAPNAKTLAAVRKQVPVVADNLVLALKGEAPAAAYNGYGSCPLTVERGKIVLAEFIYGGKHSPTFPEWLNNGTKPSKFAWFLKTKILPFVYWQQMLRGIEWFVKPDKLE